MFARHVHCTFGKVHKQGFQFWVTLLIVLFTEIAPEALEDCGILVQYQSEQRVDSFVDPVLFLSL